MQVGLAHFCSSNEIMSILGNTKRRIQFEKDINTTLKNPIQLTIRNDARLVMSEYGLAVPVTIHNINLNKFRQNVFKILRRHLKNNTDISTALMDIHETTPLLFGVFDTHSKVGDIAFDNSELICMSPRNYQEITLIFDKVTVLKN